MYLGTAQYLLLRVLLRCGSAHGPDIPAIALDYYGERIEASNVYTILKKLEQKGLVTHTIEDDAPLADRHERRRIYKLTPFAEGFIIDEAWRRSREMLTPRAKPGLPNWPRKGAHGT